MYLEYGHTLWIHDLVAKCTFKIAQALPPSFRHPEAPATLPTIIKHCPGRTKSSGGHNAWFPNEIWHFVHRAAKSWCAQDRVVSCNAELHPPEFQALISNAGSPFPGGHGFTPHFAKRTWMHFAFKFKWIIIKHEVFFAKPKEANTILFLEPHVCFTCSATYNWLFLAASTQQ